MKLAARLARLEAAAATRGVRPCHYVHLSEDDRISAPGVPGMEAWEGRRVSEWPLEWFAEPWATREAPWSWSPPGRN